MPLLSPLWPVLKHLVLIPWLALLHNVFHVEINTMGRTRCWTTLMNDTGCLVDWSHMLPCERAIQNTCAAMFPTLDVYTVISTRMDVDGNFTDKIEDVTTYDCRKTP